MRGKNFHIYNPSTLKNIENDQRYFGGELDSFWPKINENPDTFQPEFLKLFRWFSPLSLGGEMPAGIRRHDAEVFSLMPERYGSDGFIWRKRTTIYEYFWSQCWAGLGL